MLCVASQVVASAGEATFMYSKSLLVGRHLTNRLPRVISGIFSMRPIDKAHVMQDEADIDSASNLM